MFLERLIDWAHLELLESEEAQSYLRSRGSSQEQWVRHRIGYISGEFDVDPEKDPKHSDACFDREKKHLRCDSCRYRLWSSEWSEKKDDDDKEILFGKRIVGHIVLPLTTYSNSLVGFQIRSLREKVYEDFLLSHRPEAFAFGLGFAVHHVWKNGYVFLVEGPFDHQVFERLVDPAVIALTTNSVNASQMTFLKRFVNKIYWCGDLDKAGRDGLNKLIQHHGSEFNIIDVSYPRVKLKDKDIGDFWKSVGDVKFADHFRRII
jgi:DNA primase